MAIVPQDIILQIQCCLGVKDLLRFRCVSKSWCSSIDDPSFIKLHLSRATNSSSFEYYFLPDALDNTREIETPYDHAKILGSCNGVLALLKGSDVNYETGLDKIRLRNPSTRKSRMLPPVGITNPLLRVAFGLGYDHVSDDYKLIMIRLVQFHVGSLASEVMVYSLRSDSWRRIDDLPFYIQDKRANGVFVNNALHWVVYKKFEDFFHSLVVAFDLGVEEFRVVELPDGLDQGLLMYVKVIEGRLCLITLHREVGVAGNRGVFVFDIWMMKQYGSKQSWTKLMSVTDSELFDLRDKTVGGVRIRDLECLNVVESLVPINSNEDAMTKDHSRQEQATNNQRKFKFFCI